VVCCCRWTSWNDAFDPFHGVDCWLVADRDFG
jgi:hypothetical protein